MTATRTGAHVRFVARAIGAGAVLLMVGIGAGQTTAAVAHGDWLTYNRTLAGDRFSPLAEIDRSNVARLRAICTYALPEVTSFQTGPIVIGGIMYFTTDTISYAIDANTCSEKWKQVRHSPTPSSLGVNRGFAYLNGKLFRGTSDTHVLALNPSDGRTLWDVQLDVAAPGVTVPMAPIAWSNMVFVGNAGGDKVGVRGHVYALDASDGHVVWRFDVIPDSGPARATWRNAANVPLSGGAFWTSFTLDTASGVLYVPAGNPAPDFVPQLRPGENLYANSVIALEASSGRILAYSQVVKNDFHDWDVDSPPTLATTRTGRQIVASANKDGQLSTLDRSGVTRRLAAADRNGDGAAASRSLPHAMPLIFQKATTTRLNVNAPLSTERMTRFCPGVQGGSEWNGAAYSPAANTLYVGAVDWCVNVRLSGTAEIPPAGDDWFGADEPVAKLFDPPAQARGWLTAFDADNGTVRWQFAAPKPVLAAVTPTAGGLVFAADMGGTAYAFDAENGRILWRAVTGQSTGGGIVTYRAGGRQLVGIASGMKSPIWPGGAKASRLIVYGL